MSSAAGRPFGMNAGSFADASRETLDADAAAVAAEIAPALARQAQWQAQAAAFVAAHGAGAGQHDVGTRLGVDIEPPSPG